MELDEINNKIKEASTQDTPFEMETRSQKARKLAKDDEKYMDDQKKQINYNEQFEKSSSECSDDEIPNLEIDANIVNGDLEKRKQSTVCAYCKKSYANEEIRAHLSICPEAKVDPSKIPAKFAKRTQIEIENEMKKKLFNKDPLLNKLAKALPSDDSSSDNEILDQSKNQTKSKTKSNWKPPLKKSATTSEKSKTPSKVSKPISKRKAASSIKKAEANAKKYIDAIKAGSQKAG